MNLIDIIILIPIVWGAFRGFRNGFLIEMATLVGLVAGIFLALIAADVAGRVMVALVDWNPIPFKFLAFAIVFVLVVVVLKFLAKVIEHMLKAIHLNFINRLAGLLVGALKLALILSIFLIFINYLNPHITILSENAREDSLLLPHIEKLIHYVLPAKDFIPLPKSWVV
jgi:membrane protein required for colicin V production